MVLEDQGIRVFSEDIFKLHAKAEICKSGVNYALPAFKPADENTFFDLENDVNGGNKVSGDQEMVHLPVSACLVNPTNPHGRRKREEEMNEEAMRNKIVKYNFHENSVTEKFLPFVVSDALISGSEVNTPAHGNEMETTVHDDGDEDMEDMG